MRSGHARLLLLCAVPVIGVLVAGGVRGGMPDEGRYPDARGSLTYGPEASPQDRELVEGAIARVRPEAREVLAPVLGAVTIKVGSPGQGVAGRARQLPDGRFEVELNLGLIHRLLGPRGTDRLVLHEIGHVVDWARTPPPLDAEIDRLTPVGFGCDGGNEGACASVRERFAEGFSKWATGDIGAQAGAVLGYRVPPPSDLERWGRTLMAGIRDRGA